MIEKVKRESSKGEVQVKVRRKKKETGGKNKSEGGKGSEIRGNFK